MRFSQYFIKTTKTIPKDEQSLNAQLLIKAGFIYKEMAGVYALLPLGLRVIDNIKSIIREEMNNIGSSEMLMPSLQSKEPWEKTGRWNDEIVDVWFKSELKNKQPIGLGWSHEEPMMAMISKYVSSYRDLPFSVYQFQTKLRNELRAKSGIMRGREFLMKDMYGFSRNQQELDSLYNKTIDAYLKIYDRLGLGDKTYLTYASGGAFTQFSHEFQTITDSGEDIIYLDKTKRLAVNQEVYSDKILKQLSLKKDELVKLKAAEVGNIFNFGSVKAEQMDVYFTDENSNRSPVYLSSYGIGVSRLMGVLAELFNDSSGLMWPYQVAPFKVYLMSINQKSGDKFAEDIYNILTMTGIEVIYDDRDIRPGEKFADADLIGLPWRVVVNSEKAAIDQFEIKARNETKPVMVNKENLITKVANKY